MKSVNGDGFRLYSGSLAEREIVSNPGNTTKPCYRKRNEIERLFRCLKGFRRIFSRFEKLDALFLGFLTFALIVEALNNVNTP